MSNLTPDDVDLRLSATKAELTGEDQRLWLGLEDEKISRIAGDEANKQFTELVKQQNSGTESRLSTEVIHRSEGDVSNLNSLNAVAQALSDYRIKTDLEINNEVIARKALGVELNTRIDSFVSTWDHQKYLIYQAVQDVQDDIDGKYSSMDSRIKKYEDMLQDITTDSIQITMDNGEINMGAWTILSQAREWDLQIIGRMKDYQLATTGDLNQALEDMQNKLPVEQNIIDKAIQGLSNSQVIKDLDEKLTSNIADIGAINQDLLDEVTARQNEMIAQAQNTANAIKSQADELTAAVLAETAARIDAVTREADIRTLQIEGINSSISEETEERIEEIRLLNDGLTAEVNSRVEGDQNITTALDNYKESNDAALANVRNTVEVLVSDTTVMSQTVSSLDARLTVTEADTATANSLAASANEKANTALTTTTSLAERMESVEASIETVQGDLTNKVDVIAFNSLKTEVTAIDGRVTTNTANIASITGNITDISSQLIANTTAISELSTEQTQQGNDIEQVSSQITQLSVDIDSVQNAVANKADASAVASLTTQVNQQGENITLINSDITTLKGSVSTIEGNLASKADVTAFNALDSKVTTVDGKVTALNSNVISLESRIITAEAGLATKAEASALNNIYTKTESDNAIAGQLITMRSQLAAGARNFVRNTKEPAQGIHWLYQRPLTAKLTGIFTISFDVEALDDTPVSGSGAGVGFNRGNGGEGGFNYVWYPNLAMKGHVTHTLTLDSGDFTHFGIYANNYVKITNVMVQRGGVDYPWAAAPEDNEAAIEANAQAIRDTNSTVATIDGKVTAQATDILNLSNGLTNLNNSKLDASVIQQYRTAVDQDSVTAGELTQFKSTLKVGGVNVLLNSKEPRSGANEYLMYENSVELKDFYDQNLNKDVTVSCEILVPVAGNVQIYTSNQSAHYFSFGTPIPANQWTHVVATVKPIPHDTNPNYGLSSLEFYGEYGTGRIVTVRNVQLEAGNFATDWAPSPRDYAEDADSVATALSETNTRVGSVENGIASQANQLISLSAKLNARKVYQLYSGGLEAVTGSMGWLKGFDPNSYYDIGRSYGLVVFNGDGSIQSVSSYDVYGGYTQGFIDAVAAVPPGTYVAVLTSDEPSNNKGLIKPSLRSLGGSDAIDQVVGRGAYLLVGRKGLPTGQAIEKISNTTSFGVDYLLEMYNGVPIGLGGSSPQSDIVSNMRTEVSNIGGNITSLSETVTQHTASLTKLSLGGFNLLYNGDFSTNSYSGWNFTAHITPAETIAVLNRNGGWLSEWALDADPSRTLVINTQGAHPVDGPQYIDAYQKIAVSGDSFYQLSAYVAPHRSKAIVYATFFNHLSEIIGYSTVGVEPNSVCSQPGAGSLGGKLLQNYRRIHVNTKTPPDTAYMYFNIRFVSFDGAYLFMTRTMCCQVSSLNAPLMPWNEGSSAAASVSSISLAKVTEVDGRVTSQASSITQLQTDVAGNSSKLIVQGEVVNGLKASYVVKTDVNGLVAGYGLYNTGSTSAFGVNADYFYVGNGTTATGGKKPFMVLTSAQTIGGVTYPAGTWIDVALIASATIGTAHIADASITNAKIVDLHADKITAGYINADRIASNTLTAEKLTVGTGVNIWPNQFFRLDGAYPTNWNGSSHIGNPVDRLRGRGVLCYGRDHLAHYTSAFGVKTEDTFLLDYTIKHTGGPDRPCGVGLWFYDVDGNTIDLRYPIGEQVEDLGDYYFRKRSTVVVPSSGCVRAVLFIQIEQAEYEPSRTEYLIGDLTIKQMAKGELIVNGSITADKIDVGELSAISANLGTIKVGSANIADLAVNGAHISDAAITSAKIGDLSVDTLKIADNAVSIGIGAQGVSTITTVSNGGKLRLDIGVQASYSSTNIATTMGVRVLRNGTVIRTFSFPATYLGSEGLTRFSYTCALPPVMETIAAGTTVTYVLQVTDFNGAWRGTGSNGLWVGNSGLSMAITELKK